MTHSIGVVWYFGFIYIVATKRTNYYLAISILSSLALVAYIIAIVITQSEVFSVSFVIATLSLLIIVTLALVIPTCVLAAWLAKRLSPKSIESNETYIDARGSQRSKIVYEFPDL